MALGPDLSGDSGRALDPLSRTAPRPLSRHPHLPKAGGPTSCHRPSRPSAAAAGSLGSGPASLVRHSAAPAWTCRAPAGPRGRSWRVGR